MKGYKVFIIFSLAIYSNISIAQQKNIFIVDSLFKTPIQFAVVQYKKYIALSDDNGFVPFSHITETGREILISCIGYQSKLVSIDSIEAQNGNYIIYLSQKVSSLSEVTIKANAGSGIFKTISDFDIHLRPINNSQEVLRMVPGLFIGQHAGGGKAEQIFLRGFDIDHGTDINIAVDGMPVNMVSHAHGQGYADLHFIIPELIEKVNFNKGPYFANKGNFTTAGFVEFKTKDFLEKNFVKAEMGQFSTGRIIAAQNLMKPQHNIRTQSLYLAGEASFTQGYFDDPQNFSRFNGLLKYHGKISKSNTLTSSLSAFTSKWNASGQIPERAVADGQIGFFGAIDNNEGGKTSRYNINTELTSKFSNGGLLKNHFYYSKYQFELFSNFTFFKEDPINGDQIRQKENRAILGYNISYNKKHKIGSINTEANVGVQIRYDQVKGLELSRTKNRIINTTKLALGDVQELNVSPFLTEKFALASNLDVEIGLRHDYFSNEYFDKLSITTSSKATSILSPKINFNYRLNNHVQFYLYNGRSFHSNDTRVVVQSSGLKALPAAFGTDIGAIFKIGNKMVLQTALWRLMLKQEFVYVGDEAIVEAGGKTNRIGIDLSARYEILKHLYFDLDLNLAKPRALDVPKAESYLPLAPKITSVGGFTYRKQTGFNGSLRYRYMGDRAADETNFIVAKGYFVADAAINYTNAKWEAGISVQNIFNSRWKETQFNTESRLYNEPSPVSEIHFTAGTPFFARASILLWF